MEITKTLRLFQTYFISPNKHNGYTLRLLTILLFNRNVYGKHEPVTFISNSVTFISDPVQIPLLVDTLLINVTDIPLRLLYDISINITQALPAQSLLVISIVICLAYKHNALLAPTGRYHFICK